MSRTYGKALLVAWAVILSGCTLPGAASPTPFVFPTPNLTLTAIFAPTTSPTPASQGPSETPVVQSTQPAETSAPQATGTAALQNARPNGLPVTAEYLTQPPVIDGDLSDWSADQYGVNNVVFGASNWTGGSDLSGTYSVGWDSAHLYLAIRVTDDKFVQLSRGASIYKGDSAEILLDTNLAGDFSSASLSTDDYQIGLSPGNLDSIQPEAYRWFPSSVAGALSSVDIAAVKTDAGYDLEARIPWAVFGVTPLSGDHYGFVLSISDDDLAGTAVQQSLASSVSTRVLTNPTTWGTLVLGPLTGK